METVTPNTQDDFSQMKKNRLSWSDVYTRIERIMLKYPATIKFYGIPRGGQVVAGLTGRAVDSVEDADVIIDDIRDSGATATRWVEQYDKPIEFLYVKDNGDGWIEFPWEVNETELDAANVVTRMIEHIGEDINREGLRDTSERVVKSWSELYKGYTTDPKSLVTTFEKGSYDQMIVLKDCELYSTCEHHLQPFFGRTHIGYVPKTKVIGISKLARIAECFSRRLQIQERIGEQITDFIMKELDAKGCMCVIEARHFCMMARGVEKQNSVMVTSSLKGVFERPEVRSEFLDFIRMRS